MDLWLRSVRSTMLYCFDGQFDRLVGRELVYIAFISLAHPLYIYEVCRIYIFIHQEAAPNHHEMKEVEQMFASLITFFLPVPANIFCHHADAITPNEKCASRTAFNYSVNCI